MGRSLKQYVAISGSTGFVGKNLLKFLIQKKLKCIPVLRKDFQEGKPPILSKCSCFIHLVGLGNENNDESFEKVNVELTRKAIDICKKSKIKKLFILVVLVFQINLLLVILFQNLKLND